jgi:DHA1 family bicyclomycin/chloramphenicol resistance-like MFS transporter
MLGIGPIAAPILGSWLLVHGGWQFIFWLLGGYGLICAVMVALFLDETLDAAHVRPLRLVGVLQDYHIVIRHKVFLGYSLAGGLIMTGLFAYIAGSPFVFRELHGLSSGQFAAVFSVNAIGFMAAGVLNGRGIQHRGPFRQLRIGLVISVLAGLLLLLTSWLGVTMLAPFLVGFFFYVVSIGFVSPNAGALALSSHGTRAGTASAAMGTLQFALAAVVNAAGSMFHDGTGRPLASTMFVCAASALLVYRWLAWPAERKA